MTERPIIFNASMVRAILDGRKTVTRRPMKMQPDSDGHVAVKGGVAFISGSRGGHTATRVCPYGIPADRLWVRETFANATDFGYDADHIFYRASYTSGGPFDDVKKWTPSIYMPRWASRLTLEIQRVRVERVQDITEEEARREGCPGDSDFHGTPTEKCSDWFKCLWDSLYGPGAWDRNDFVWVIEFKRVAP